MSIPTWVIAVGIAIVLGLAFVVWNMWDSTVTHAGAIRGLSNEEADALALSQIGNTDMVFFTDGSSIAGNAG